MTFAVSELFSENTSVLREVLQKACTLFPHNSELHSLAEQLASPFSLFVCGEFNSGKSSVLNALVGKEIASVGVLPTTADLQEIVVGSLRFVDSPGLNSLIQAHTEEARRFLTRADVVLFIISSERPLSDSELQFLLEARQEWKKRVFLVVNKIDLFTEAQRLQIRGYVANGYAERLHEIPEIFLVSARTGEGISSLQHSLEALFSEEEQRKAKEQAVVDALAKILMNELEALRTSTSTTEQKLSQIQKTEKRLQERVDHALLLAGAYPDQCISLLREVALELQQFIDERFSLWTLLRAQFSGGAEKLRRECLGLLEDLRVEERLQETIAQCAEKLTSVRALLRREIVEENPSLEEGEVKRIFESAEHRPLPSAELARSLREAAERGLQRFAALSTFAAASGLSAKVSALAPVEVTGVILMVTLGYFSLRVVPREKQKIKGLLSQSLAQLGEHFSLVLRDGMKDFLSQDVVLFNKAVEPHRVELLSLQHQLQGQITTIQTLIDKLLPLSLR